MKLSLCFRVSLCRLGFVGEKPKVPNLAVALDLRNPLVQALVPANTKRFRLAVGVGFSLVLAVVGFRADAQVRNPVVGLVAVDVIDDPGGLFAICKQPCDLMRHENAPIDAQRHIAFVVPVSGNLTGPRVTGDRDFPDENPCLGIVVEQPFYLGLGNHDLSLKEGHDCGPVG